MWHFIYIFLNGLKWPLASKSAKTPQKKNVVKDNPAHHMLIISPSNNLYERGNSDFLWKLLTFETPHFNVKKTFQNDKHTPVLWGKTIQHDKSPLAQGNYF